MCTGGHLRLPGLLLYTYQGLSRWIFHRFSTSTLASGVIDLSWTAQKCCIFDRLLYNAFWVHNLYNNYGPQWHSRPCMSLLAASTYLALAISMCPQNLLLGLVILLLIIEAWWNNLCRVYFFIFLYKCLACLWCSQSAEDAVKYSESRPVGIVFLAAAQVHSTHVVSSCLYHQ